MIENVEWSENTSESQTERRFKKDFKVLTEEDIRNRTYSSINRGGGGSLFSRIRTRARGRGGNGRRLLGLLRFVVIRLRNVGHALNKSIYVLQCNDEWVE